MIFIIYCHKNRLNKKSYIGWSNKTIDKRWEIHCRVAQKGVKTLFAQALRKYGTSDDVWEHEIIESHLSSLEITKEAERFDR